MLTHKYKDRNTNDKHTYIQLVFLQDGCTHIRHLGALPVRRPDRNPGKASTDVVPTIPGQSGIVIHLIKPVPEKKL